MARYSSLVAWWARLRITAVPVAASVPRHHTLTHPAPPLPAAAAACETEERSRRPRGEGADEQCG